MKARDWLVRIVCAIVGAVVLFFWGKELFTGESFPVPVPSYYIHYTTRSPL